MNRHIFIMLCILMTLAMAMPATAKVCADHKHIADKIHAAKAATGAAAATGANAAVPVASQSSVDSLRQQAQAETASAESIRGSAQQQENERDIRVEVNIEVAALRLSLESGQELSNEETRIILEKVEALGLHISDEGGPGYGQDLADLYEARDEVPELIQLDDAQLALIQEAIVAGAVENQAEINRLNAEADAAEDRATIATKNAAELEAINKALEERAKEIEKAPDSAERRQEIEAEARAAWRRHVSETASASLTAALNKAGGDREAQARAYEQYAADRSMVGDQRDNYIRATTHTLRLPGPPPQNFINFPRNTIIPDNVQGMSVEDGEIVARYRIEGDPSDCGKSGNPPCSGMYPVGMNCNVLGQSGCSDNGDGSINPGDEGYYYGADGELYYTDKEGQVRHQAQYWPVNSFVDFLSGGPTSGLLRSLSSEIYGDRGHSGLRDQGGWKELYNFFDKMDVAEWITEELCSGNLQQTDGPAQVVLTKDGKTAIHIEGERIDVGDVCGRLPASGDPDDPGPQEQCRENGPNQSYIYRITAYVAPVDVGGEGLFGDTEPLTFNIEFTGETTEHLFESDYQIKTGDPPLDFRGNNLQLWDSDKFFDKVCLVFERTGAWTSFESQLIGMPWDGRVCNVIEGASDQSVERQYEIIEDAGGGYSGSGGYTPPSGEGSTPQINYP